MQSADAYAALLGELEWSGDLSFSNWKSKVNVN